MKAIRSAVRWSVPVVWAGGMLAARSLDPWTAIPVAATILCTAILVTDGRRMRALLQPSPRLAGTALLAALVMLAATYLLFPLVVRSIPAIGERSVGIYAEFLSGRPLWMVIGFVVPLILAEEILWRGAFQEGMAMRQPVLRVVLCGVVYAASHAPLGSALLVGVAFLCGVYWAGIRAYSDSLVPSLTAHLVWDLALILVPLTTHP